MKTSELVELLKTHDVTKEQLFNLLTEDLKPSIEPEAQGVIAFFVYQIEAVVFPVICDLRAFNKQLNRAGQVFKDELDKRDEQGS